MKLVVWGINYAPELTGIAPYNVLLCEYLSGRGHQVEMVTSFPYYPAWKKRPEDVSVLYRTDIINCVPVHRCWHYVPGGVTAWKRMLHEASFIATSFCRILRLSRPDILVVISPPLLLGLPAAVLGFVRRTPYVFHVQDLQPDAALDLGMLQPGRFAQLLFVFEKIAYSRASRVSGITRGMLRAFTRKGVPSEKQLYFPNGVVLSETAALPERGSFRKTIGIADDRFIALYSGNLGVKQGLAILLEAAAHCPEILILICGDGAERESLSRQAAARHLANLVFLPLQVKDDYAAMLVDSDICLITQQAGSGQVFFPSKLLTTLAFGRPVLAVADEDSELAMAVHEGCFGFCVPPGNYLQLAEQLNLAAKDPNRLAEMGKWGRDYVERFAAPTVLEAFERALQEMMPISPSADGGPSMASSSKR